MPMLKRVSILLVILTCIITAAQAYYDPYTDRFTQRDPIGDGVNWCAYTYNNPLKFVDPTGLQTEPPRALSPLEVSALNFMFQGSINPDNLTIQIVTDLHVGDIKANGAYTGGEQNLIQIDSKWYLAAGLSANSTASTDIILSHDVIAYLSILIHESAHHWQDVYGGWAKHKIGEAGKNLYGFTFAELQALNLGNEQFASAVSGAFILSWQLDHGAEMVDLHFHNFHRWFYNHNPNIEGHYGPNSIKAFGGWGRTVDRTIAGSLLWFLKPLMAHIGS